MVIIYNRFADSSKCGPRDFDPPPSQKLVPARLSTCTSRRRVEISDRFQLGPGSVDARTADYDQVSRRLVDGDVAVVAPVGSLEHNQRLVDRTALVAAAVQLTVSTQAAGLGNRTREPIVAPRWFNGHQHPWTQRPALTCDRRTLEDIIFKRQRPVFEKTCEATQKNVKSHVFGF